MLNWEKRTLLFLGDFLPLFLIGMLFSIPSLNLIELVIFIALLIISIIGTYYWKSSLDDSVKSNRDSRKDNTVIKTVDDKGSIYTNYIVTYISVLPLLSYNWEGLVSFMIILLIVYSLYMNSDMLFYNPILGGIGYKFYKVEIENISDSISQNKEIYVISRVKIKKAEKSSDQGYQFFTITDYIYYLKQVKEIS